MEIEWIGRLLDFRVAAEEGGEGEKGVGGGRKHGMEVVMGRFLACNYEFFGLRQS